MAWRAFVGVSAGDQPALRALLDDLSGTRADVKVVDPAQLHFTLAFLGDVSDDAADGLGEALDDATAGVRPFDVQLQGVGAFPHEQRPRVVWAGTAGAEPLVALAQRVRDALSDEGHPGDDKPFRPHVTLARVKSQRNAPILLAWLRQHANDALPKLDVREVRLYKSTLGPAGPTYEVVHRARLEE